MPFDAAYKLMATFHRMTDEAGKRRRPRLRQGRPGPAPGPRRDRDRRRPGSAVAVDDDVRGQYLAENDRLAAQGLRVMATARKDFDPATFDPRADLLPLVTT